MPRNVTAGSRGHRQHRLQPRAKGFFEEHLQPGFRPALLALPFRKAGISWLLKGHPRLFRSHRGPALLNLSPYFLHGQSDLVASHPS